MKKPKFVHPNCTVKQGIIIIISFYPENGWMGDSTEGQDNQGVGGQEGGLPVHLQQGRCQGKVVLQGRGNQPSKWEYTIHIIHPICLTNTQKSNYFLSKSSTAMK